MKTPLQIPDLKNAFRPAPPAFRSGVEDTLRRLQTQKEEQPVKKKIPLALVLALIAMILLAGVAAAASLSPTVDWFGWFYGDEFKAELEKGDVAHANQSAVLGDLTYTLYDVVYSDGVLYGSGSIAVTEGKTAVLLAEDYQVTDPAGYLLHLGEEDIPEDAATYAQVAHKKKCPILLCKLVPDGYLVNDQLQTGDIGYNLIPQKDGTVLFAFEIYVGNEDPTATAMPDSAAPIDAKNAQGDIRQGIQRSRQYTLSLRMSCWEVTQDGQWLREEPNNTWLKDNWIITVTAQME